MHDTLIHAATVFMGFFAIMNPVANVPVFLGLTSDEDEPTTVLIALQAVLLAFLIVTLFAVGGKIIFELFGLTLPAFRITGGLLVFMVGFHMLQGNHSSVQHPREKEKEPARQGLLGVAISPLAMPILAGPGTIATAMNFASGAGLMELIVTIVMFAILCAITYLLFVFGERLVRILGASFMGVITRMMGLILAAIGTQMVIEGIQGAFKLTS